MYRRPHFWSRLGSPSKSLTCGHVGTLETSKTLFYATLGIFWLQPNPLCSPLSFFVPICLCLKMVAKKRTGHILCAQHPAQRI